VHYGVLVHEGDVVTVEGEIMHEPKASVLSARDRYYIARVKVCIKRFRTRSCDRLWGV